MLRRIARPVAAGLASAALVRTAYCDSETHPRLRTQLPSSSVLDGLSFKGQYRGQLSPPLPQAGSSKGAIANDASGIHWQRGAYGSWWLRLGCAGNSLPKTEQVSTALDEMLSRAKADKAAAYVGVQELEAEPNITALLRARGFRYHHFAPNKKRAHSSAGGSGYEIGEHVYYQWMGDPSHDMVPSYATSIEGVGALILSPDEKRVLLVWECARDQQPHGPCRAHICSRA